MTKKDYIIIANAIKPLIQSKQDIPAFMLVNVLVYAFKADNPRFDEQKFREWFLK